MTHMTKENRNNTHHTQPEAYDHVRAGVDPRFDLKRWLPTSVKEARLQGWEQPDIVIFSGDAYVDHPSFGAAVIGLSLIHISEPTRH